MKLFPSFFLIAFLLSEACKPAQKPVETDNLPPVDKKVSAFNTWLKTNKIPEGYFNDTIPQPADSFWNFPKPLERTDSLYYWYPSTDSSFYLLSNIDRNSGKSAFSKEAENSEYHFLKTNSKEVHIGITLRHTSWIPKDIYWHDKSIIYLLGQDKDSMEHELVKLNMQVDTIWWHRHRKAGPPNVKPSSGQ